MPETIYTDSRGVPYERPEPPDPEGSIEDQIAWMRSFWAWKDKRADASNKAFMRAFNKAAKGKS